MRSHPLLPVVLAFASLAYAGISTKCVTSDVCYSLNIPDTTVSTGTGDIYVQISGPSSYSWLSVGQGRSMSGANFFIIYTDSSGSNVTLSPRLSSGGHNMPTYNSAANMALLAGSGVSNGVMTANIRCSNCASWSGGSMDLKSSSTEWIWAVQSGGPLNVDSQSATITQHDSYGTLAFDSAAQGGSDVNPFLSANGTDAVTEACSSVVSNGSPATSVAGSGGHGHGSGNEGSNSDVFPAATVGYESHATGLPNFKRSSDKLTAEMLVKRATSPSACGSLNSSSSGVVIGGGVNSNLIAAHGVFAAGVFCIVFPVGGIMIRLLSFSKLLWAHGILQVVGYVTYFCSMALGVYLALKFKYLGTGHAIIGLVLAAVLFLQAPLGYIHHKAFKRTGGRTWSSYLHLFIGRIAIPLGIINATLGVKLARDSAWKTVAIVIIGGGLWLAYLCSIFVGEARRSRTAFAKSAAVYNSDGENEGMTRRASRRRRSQGAVEAPQDEYLMVNHGYGQSQHSHQNSRYYEPL